MYKTWFLKVLGLAIFAAMLFWAPAGAQVRPPEQIQQSMHRAETAWRNRTSLLEAKVHVDRVLQDAPDHAEALKLRAEVLLAMRRYREAFEDARRVTEVIPSDGAAWLILTEAARLNGDLERARAALERAAALSVEKGADFHIRLSRSAMMLGESEWGRAESYARVALAQDRSDAAAYYQLARVFMLQGRTEDAVTTLLPGFEAELLDPIYIESDSTLNVLKDHIKLQPYWP